MVDPVFALTVFFALCVVAAVVSWPRWGIVGRMWRRSGWGKRVQLEDALKRLRLRERQDPILTDAGREVATSRFSLADIAVGETVRVTGLSPACQGPQRRRLLDLGLVRGGAVTPELVSTSKDPIAYRIRGALIALRREQASWVSVADVEPTELVGSVDSGAGSEA